MPALPVGALAAARTTRPVAAPALATPPPARWFPVVVGVLLVAVPVVLTAAISVGAVWIPPGEVWRSITSHLAGGHGSSAINDQIIWDVRVPRVLLAFVVGAGLAVAGTVLQAVVRNPLADPYVLGVSSGASLAAVAVLTLGGLASSGLAARIGVSGAAFGGAVATLAMVLLLGRRQQHLDPQRLLLAGVALSYLFQAGTSYLQLRVGPNQLAAVLFWLMGTVSGAEWDKLGVPTAVVVAATGYLFVQARALNALALGDEAAASLGIAVSRLRTRLLIVAAALTAAVISVAGGVGFVGLLAPHCVRLLIGSDHRRLLPVAALLGGVFLVLADLLGRVVAQPWELPLSVITAAAGVPFFLVLLRRSGRSGPLA
ncbi:iron ABC transporter permease [Frankia sp. AgPm24]|uniref:FecCD family ABC transporter permease n=1 Tax=Frankia sp. AgPm24 TaxID=631128 RepID=UPI0020105396|nr:iron ABC transporter permease [Frankia sp. AgPm24]